MTRSPPSDDTTPLPVQPLFGPALETPDCAVAQGLLADIQDPQPLDEACREWLASCERELLQLHGLQDEEEKYSGRADVVR